MFFHYTFREDTHNILAMTPVTGNTIRVYSLKNTLNHGRYLVIHRQFLMLIPFDLHFWPNTTQVTFFVLCFTICLRLTLVHFNIHRHLFLIFDYPLLLSTYSRYPNIHKTKKFFKTNDIRTEKLNPLLLKSLSF